MSVSLAPDYSKAQRLVDKNVLKNNHFHMMLQQYSLLHSQINSGTDEPEYDYWKAKFNAPEPFGLLDLGIENGFLTRRDIVDVLGDKYDKTFGRIAPYTCQKLQVHIVSWERDTHTLHYGAVRPLKESQKKELITAINEEGFNVRHLKYRAIDTKRILQINSRQKIVTDDEISTLISEFNHDPQDPLRLKKVKEYILLQALQAKASNIKLVKSNDVLECVISFTIGQTTAPKHVLSVKAAGRLMQAFKDDAKMDPIIKDRPQDGHIEMVFQDRKVNFRAATGATVSGEFMSLRVHDLGSIMSLHILLNRFPELADNLRHYMRQKDKGGSLICLSGTTGSGKTALLAALQREADRLGCTIISIAAPVEMRVRHTQQMQINEDIGQTANVLTKAAMRLFPDILIQEEVRDPQTAEGALRNGDTGHKTGFTIHAVSAISAAAKIVSMVPEEFKEQAWNIIGDILHYSLHLKLIKKLCSCALVDEDAGGNILKRNPHGCPKCDYTGYDGMVQCPETLQIGDGLEVRHEALKALKEHRLADLVKLDGVTYRPRDYYARRLYDEGVIDHETYQRQRTIDVLEVIQQKRDQKAQEIMDTINNIDIDQLNEEYSARDEREPVISIEEIEELFMNEDDEATDEDR
ncbi:hypothetical protein MTBPR1_80146 [Candidatus Terasakiella magnetica]|uniref:AAA+ ATPase domain-containing protein n=1 Tax=Candidatus Terasakiella magnetica TaxID=1867952 RepID=A0A1C3RLB8_9PROT|nr:ATPase, T2SS/T4P/T4SS family [Candidatus Terasakiella magnetica]SCA58092.1 hypothetical protein MTBPR1_80146 [Candidatus Terasakiella magnetica]